MIENYPLAVGGIDDYPVKVGSMLLTMVEPHRGFERFHVYTAAIEATGLATTVLVAPFLRTVVGTDTYVDQLW